MTERSRRVVLLIDYDNLQICASRDTPGRELQLPPVVQLAQRYGTVIMARAYAEWNLSTERLAVYKAGIEPAFAPVLRTESDRSGKSLADTVMVAEGMDMLWTLAPEVVVLATSDKDLIPLVRVAKQRGAFVVVLGSDFTAIPLREMADEHVTYRQLITDPSGRFIGDVGSSRAPATLTEPARRRPRERTGRERVSPPPTGTAPAPSRPEREPVAASSFTAPAAASAGPVGPSAAAAPSSSSIEGVPAVGGGLAGEGDGQLGGRRRRRRGSRRRSDRLGGPGEGLGSTGLNGFGSEDGGDEDESEGESEITPTTSAVDVALSSSGTVEAPELDLPAGPTGEVPEPVEPEPPAPVVRDRRRRTRRPAAGADAPAAASGEDAAASGEDEGPTTVSDNEPPLTQEPLADMLAGGEPLAPVSENGTEAGSDAGGEDAPPARAARPRRVASASRGRRTR